VDRLAWAAAFDARGWEGPNFTNRVTASLGRAFDRGAVGVKIWKNIGMAIKSKKTGEYLKPDNAALMPIYEMIQKAGRTLLVHVADPDSGFVPLPRRMAPLWLRLYLRPTPVWWQLYRHSRSPDNWWILENRPGSPGKHELLLCRDRILARHPKLRVVGVHLGSNGEDLGALARRLDTYPNFAVDLAAAVSTLAQYEREIVRQFLLKYQDRVLYGSDVCVLDGQAGDEESWQSMNAIQERDWSYFAGEGPVTFDAFRPQHPPPHVRGLALSATVLRKIFHENPKRWFPGIIGNRNVT
jgi:predicted TIM-barrel fold metal-dependent hydrolase